VTNGSASKVNITDEFAIPRQRMVDKLRDHYKITDTRVLDVMRKLPRHLFVPEALRSQAYKDNALPIASGVTLYVAASDLIPEVNHHGGHGPAVSVSIFAGVALFFLLHAVLQQFLGNV